jgi:hypothetical protein
MAISNSCRGSISRMVYRESIRRMALGTRIFRYNPSKSNEEMLIGVYGE